MKIGILIAVILYEVLTIVGVGVVISIKNRKKQLAQMDLP